MAKGDDVRRWRIEEKDRWLIFTRRGVKIDDYPAIKAHLEQWREQLEPGKPGGRKAGSYKWFEIQDNVAYYEAFDKPKIVIPDIASESRCTFDTAKMFLANTCYFIPQNDLYLLGVLNSSSVWSYAKEKLTVVGDAEQGGRLRFFSQFVNEIPIPDAPASERLAIAALVQKCLDARGVSCAAWEAEINARVAALYGL